MLKIKDDGLVLVRERNNRRMKIFGIILLSFTAIVFGIVLAFFLIVSPHLIEAAKIFIKERTVTCEQTSVTITETIEEFNNKKFKVINKKYVCPIDDSKDL